MKNWQWYEDGKPIIHPFKEGVVTAWVPNRRSVINSREDWQPIRASTYTMYKQTAANQSLYLHHVQTNALIFSLLIPFLVSWLTTIWTRGCRNLLRRLRPGGNCCSLLQWLYWKSKKNGLPKFPISIILKVEPQVLLHSLQHLSAHRSADPDFQIFIWNTFQWLKFGKKLEEFYEKMKRTWIYKKYTGFSKI